MQLGVQSQSEVHVAHLRFKLQYLGMPDSSFIAAFAGTCGVRLVERQQPAASSSEKANGRQGWAPEWLSSLAAKERLRRYKMDEAPLMRAMLVRQVWNCLAYNTVWPALKLIVECMA